MNPKSKKVLAEQGSQVTQALKWVGEAIFGDTDDVLDDMAAKSEAKAPPRRELPKPRVAVTARPVSIKPAPKTLPEVIDVEAFLDDEDDE